MANTIVLFAFIGALAGEIAGLLAFAGSLPTTRVSQFFNYMIMGAIGGVIAGTSAAELQMVTYNNTGPMIMAMTGGAMLVAMARGFRIWQMRRGNELHA